MAPEYLPPHVDELFRLGMAAERRDEHAEAIRLFQTAVGALGGEDHVLIRLNLAISQLHDRQFHEAAEGLRWCEEQTRDDEAWEDVRYVVLYNLARAEGELALRGVPGQDDEALETARAVALSAAGKIAAAEKTRRESAEVAHAVEARAVALLATLQELFVDRGMRSRTSDELDRASLVRGLAGDDWRRALSAADLAEFVEANHGSEPRTRVDLSGYFAQFDRGRAQELVAAVDVPSWAEESRLGPADVSRRERVVEEAATEAAKPRAAKPAVQFPEEELRLGSIFDAPPELAVWSSGCAAELDRAQLRSIDGASMTVYAALCRAFARRATIDVVSAASGGAPSGALLAEALWSGRPLESQRAREAWPPPRRRPSEPAPDGERHLGTVLDAARSRSGHAAPRGDSIFAIAFPTNEDVPDALRRRARDGRIVFRGSAQPDSATLALAAVAAARSGDVGDGAVRAARDLAAMRPISEQARRAFVRVGTEPAAPPDEPERPIPLELLTMPSGSLRDTAEALFGTYSRWRRRSSISQALGEGGDAEPVDERLADLPLPWIPPDPGARVGDEWGWGVAPARRAVDVLAALSDAALAEASPEGQDALLAALVTIQRSIVTLGEIASEADEVVSASLTEIARGDPVEPALGSLRRAFEPLDRRIRAAVRRAADAAQAVRTELDPEVADGLLGAESDAFGSFLDRVLGIEVVWSPTAAAAEGRQLPRLSAITPDAPALVLDDGARRRWSAQDKLIDDHPSSMRANDFLWGRMDAAVTIVDLLMDVARPRSGVGAHEPWRLLARELERPDRAWLVAERMPAAEGQPAPTLEAVLENDLRRDAGTLTRAFCIRAAQLEILEEELPGLIGAAQVQGLLTDLAADAPVKTLIEQLREGKTLRERLVATPPEASSRPQPPIGARETLSRLADWLRLRRGP